MVAVRETSPAWSALGEEGPATMKKEKSHGQDEADCRAKLILINGDKAPGVVLEANGKPSTPGEGHTLSPECSRVRRVGMSQPLSQALLCAQSPP
ncbi:hypothetical protein EK904_002266 [Melospiza melodia maxima]|nr:hypothetical protein EK904_002266 [Melospiza melodia maxima]